MMLYNNFFYKSYSQFFFKHKSSMKLFLLFGLILSDLIGYNRQHGVAYKSQQETAQLPDHTQDQIIIHLAKNGEFKLLRKFLATVRANNWLW